jgi:predicted transcriptional regulator
MEKSLLLQLTGEMPLFKIIDFLIENKGVELTKKEIIEGAGISRAALFKYWNELEKNNLVRVTRQFGKTRLYTLNTQSLIIKKILDLEKVLISEALDKSSKKELTLMR